MNPILMITSHVEGRLSPMTRELAGAAVKVRQPGQSLGLLAVPDLDPGQVSALVAHVAGMHPPPTTLILAHGGRNRDLAPRLALALDGGYVAGATALEKDSNHGAWWLRPVAGNEQVQPVSALDSHPLVVTLMPGSFPQAPLPQARYLEFPEIFQSKPPQSHPHQSRPTPCGITCLGREVQASPDQALTHARVVVAVGRGMGDPENLELVKQMVAAIPGAALGASRPLVDQGLVPHAHQVGITGARVAPELYLALGISGSTQHLAGMAGSRTIIAVNHSPDCPMFRHADICIHSDVPDFIHAFLDSNTP